MKPHTDQNLFSFLSTLALPSLSWPGLLRRSSRRLLHWDEINKLEIVALVVGGVLAGLFFWVISLQKLVVRSSGTVDVSVDNLDDLAAWRTELYVCFGVPLFLLVFLLGATFFVGVSSSSTRIDRRPRMVVSLWRLGLDCSCRLGRRQYTGHFWPDSSLERPQTARVRRRTFQAWWQSCLGIARDGCQTKTDQRKRQVTVGLNVGFDDSFLPLLALVFLAGSMATLSPATTGITLGIGTGRN